MEIAIHKGHTEFGCIPSMETELPPGCWISEHAKETFLGRAEHTGSYCLTFSEHHAFMSMESVTSFHYQDRAGLWGTENM